MFSNLVLGTRPGPRRSACLAVAVVANWLGLLVAVSHGWWVGVPVMVGGMLVAGAVNRLSAPMEEPEGVTIDLRDRVHARLEEGELETIA
jgi:hypothetical protein